MPQRERCLPIVPFAPSFFLSEGLDSYSYRFTQSEMDSHGREARATIKNNERGVLSEYRVHWNQTLNPNCYFGAKGLPTLKEPLQILTTSLDVAVGERRLV